MEFWDVYDESGKKTGETRKKGLPFGPCEYHLAIEAWVVRPGGEILIQKRSLRCEILPGIWALTTGRAVSGETSLECCLREVSEELGICALEKDVTLLRRINRKDESHMIWDVYLVRADISLSDLSLQKEEVADARFLSFTELQKAMGEANFFVYPEMGEMLDACREAL